MEQIIFVEVLDRRGRVKERTRLDRFPASIGRAYTNDIIIDDRYVSHEHLRIVSNEKGDLVVEDLNSENGLYLHMVNQRLDRVSVKPETMVRIGHTVLRFRRPDYKVSSTADMHGGFNTLYRLFENKPSALGIFFICFAILAFSIYMSSYEEATQAKLVSYSLLVLFLLSAWAGVWAFINRIVSHSFHYLSHLAIAGLAAAGFSIFFEFTDYYSFVFSPGLSLEIIEIAGFSLLCAAVLSGHLSIASTMSRARLLFSSAFTSVGIIGVFLFFSYVQHTEFSNSIEFPYALKPFGNKYVLKVASDEFFEEAEKLKEKVDKLASED